jgi:hypothetical protein
MSSSVSIGTVAKAAGLSTTFTLGLVLASIAHLISGAGKQTAKHFLITAILSRALGSFIKLMLMFYGFDKDATTAFWYISNYSSIGFRVGSYGYLYLKASAILKPPHSYLAMLGCGIDMIFDLVYRGMITVKFSNGLVVSDASSNATLKVVHETLGIFLVIWYQAFLLNGLKKWSESLKSVSAIVDLVDVMKKSNVMFLVGVCVCRFIDAVCVLTKAYSSSSIFDISEFFHQAWLVLLALDFILMKSSRANSVAGTQKATAISSTGAHSVPAGGVLASAAV